MTQVSDDPWHGTILIHLTVSERALLDRLRLETGLPIDKLVVTALRNMVRTRKK
jgi:hypothetical protein